MYNEKGGLQTLNIVGRHGENFVRNRGYKFIINENETGYWILCINATWINHLLRDRGIEPRNFRALNWRDIASAAKTDKLRQLTATLRPANFWQMCDVIALSESEYDDDCMPVYRQRWFTRYPIFTVEDVYELLLENGFTQEDALRVTMVVKRGEESLDGVSLRDFLELYDVPEDLEKVILRCRKLVSRHYVIDRLTSMAGNLIKVERRMKED